MTIYATKGLKRFIAHINQDEEKRRNFISLIVSIIFLIIVIVAIAVLDYNYTIKK